MKNLLAVGTAVALASSFSARVMADVVVNDRSDIDLVVFVPCADGGAGEFVQLSGPLHVLITFNTNGNNVNGKTHFQPQGISGVGSTTGDMYRGTGVTQEQFKGSLQNGQFETTFINNFRMIGQGPGNNFLVHETFHLTINANGDVTAVHDNLTVDCK